MIPYFWVGSKAYDLVAGSAGFTRKLLLVPFEGFEDFPNVEI